MEPVFWHRSGAFATSLNWTLVGEMDPAVATARQSNPLSLPWPTGAAS